MVRAGCVTLAKQPLPQTTEARKPFGAALSGQWSDLLISVIVEWIEGCMDQKADIEERRWTAFTVEAENWQGCADNISSALRFNAACQACYY